MVSTPDSIPAEMQAAGMIEMIELPEDVTNEPKLRRRGNAPSFEEFQNDPKAYSMARGLRPDGLRNHVIMPTNVQVRMLDGTLVEMPRDILRRIDFSRNYRGHGINAKKRQRLVERREQEIADHLKAGFLS